MLAPSRPDPTFHLSAVLLVPFLLVVLAPTLPAAGQELEIDLAHSLLFDEDFDEAIPSFRVSGRLTERFRWEGRLGYLDVGRLEIWTLDATLKFFFDDRGRTRWYVAGGPGTSFEALGDIGEGRWIFHSGIGAHVELTPHLYLRPEALVRWNESGFDTLGGDLSLGLGWRF